MKMRLLFFTLLLSLVLCMPAMAEVKDFDKFTALVPAGWTTDKDDDTVVFMGPDNSAVITVTVVQNDGTALEELAKQAAADLKGTAPEKDDDGYMFTFKNDNGVDGFAVVTGDDKHVALITVTGEHADVEKILGSIEDK